MTTSAGTLARTAGCPACGGESRLPGRMLIGEVLGCGSCGTQLEVASTDPLLLELLAKVDEDEDDPAEQRPRRTRTRIAPRWLATLREARRARRAATVVERPRRRVEQASDTTRSAQRQSIVLGSLPRRGPSASRACMGNIELQVIAPEGLDVRRAEFYVDGLFVGNATESPRGLELHTGERRIRCDLQGCTGWERAVAVLGEPNHQAVHVFLERAAPPDSGAASAAPG